MKQILNLLFLAVLFSGPTLADGLKIVNPEQLLEMQPHKNAIIVDIRTEADWRASGIIANSHALQPWLKAGNSVNPNCLTIACK
ncbi:MAG: hypothetical protein PHR94_02465 [Methylomonas lenta]|nr:hypothetical protein [Methylomonas lenta]